MNDDNLSFHQSKPLPSIEEITSTASKSPEAILSKYQTLKCNLSLFVIIIILLSISPTKFITTDKDSPSTSTAKSSRRDSLNERVVVGIDNFMTPAELQPPSSQESRISQNIPIQSPVGHSSHSQQKNTPQRAQQPQLQYEAE